MKRKFKRIASFVLAAVMVFAMAMPAMAGEKAENFTEFTSPTITIKTNAGDHVYEAYQIFSGRMATNTDGDYYLSNIVWGSGVNEDALATLKNEIDDALKKYYEAIPGDKEPWDATNAELVAAALNQGLEPAAKSFAQVIAGALSSTYKESEVAIQVGKEYEYSIIVSGVGYYFIKDKSGVQDGTDDAYTEFMLQVVGDVDVNAKSSYPTVTKKVQDVNDSKDGVDGKDNWKDSADYDIDDVIPFQLTGTVAENYGEYDEYYYAFHDTLSGGLTFNDDVVVTIGGKVVDPSCYSVTVTPPLPVDAGTETRIDIAFTNLKNVKATAEDGGEAITIDKTTQIVVNYSATLNASAVLGNPGNPNEVTLEYSNNPNEGGEGSHGNTPKDTVVVFTFEVDVNKVDKDHKPLEGAGFTLQKWNKTTAMWEDVGDEIKSEDGETTFSFKGVDDGYYKLIETTTPPGYNTMDPIYFEITADHTETLENAEGGKIEVTTLKATQISWNEGEKKPGSAIEGKDAYSFTVGTGAAAENTYAKLTTDVVNLKGTTLPETGGIGTTIFYVVGSVLVLAAVILLVTKRRMKSE